MRSRVIQPRALFRIAGGGVTATGSSTSTHLASASATAAASTSSASTSTSTSSTATHPACLGNRDSRTAFASRAGISSLARRGAKSSSAGSNSSNSSGSNSKGASTLVTATGGNGGSEGKQSDKLARSRQQQQPVIPVTPPPHSSKAVALQSFFSQGRPLLEHNNIDGNGSPMAQLPSGQSGLSTLSSARSPAIAMVVDVEQEGSSVSGGEVIDASDRDSLLAQLKSQGGEHFTDEELEEATEKVSEMLREANSSGERMDRLVQLGGQTPSLGEGLHSFPEELQTKIREKAAQLMKSMENIGDELGALDLSNGSEDLLSVSLHLPTLQNVDQRAFEKVLDNVSSTPSSTSSLLMHSQIRTRQLFEKSRKELINEAKMNGEDASLASALGPESELMVLGEPNGPQKEWGRGVTSWLARYGRPYQLPDAPTSGSEASQVQRIENMTAFELEDDHQKSSPASTDAEDVNLWLGHAMVQNKMQASLEWQRLESLMSGSQQTSPSDLHSANLRLLNATLPASTLSELVKEKESETVVNMDSVKRKRKKKMRKMKYKKLRKRQRAERLRMKK